MSREDVCKQNNCTRTDAHTHPLPTPPPPLPRMSEWRVVWAGLPWVQPLVEGGETQTPMCRFCCRMYNSHQPDCVARER